MTRETGVFTISHAGESFSGDYGEVMLKLIELRYDWSDDGLNRRWGNIKDHA